MKAFIIPLLLLELAVLGQGGCLKAREQDPNQSVILSGKLNLPVISDRGETVYLQLSVHTPRIGHPHRKPLNVSVVLDRSGSMGDKRKIDFAKSAITSLVGQLSSNDILSIVTYDDVVEVLKPAGRVGNQRELMRLIDKVYPRGSTNLGGGMIEGYAQVSKFANKEFTNRVILLSDGLANQGITDPNKLNAIARRKRTHAVSLTTMGVGLEYNENLMVGLARYGGGNYYFIEHPRSIAHILGREFESLSSVLAQDAVIKLRLGEGVRLKDAIGYEWSQAGNECTIAMGDLTSDALNELTLELQVPAGRGTMKVASGTLEYESDKLTQVDVPSFATTVSYTERPEVVEKNRNMDLQAKADVAVSTRKVEEAMDLLDAGKNEDAQQALVDAKAVLRNSPAAASSGAGGRQIKTQEAQIGSFHSLLKDSTDTRKAKKAIQYKNYRIQKHID